MKSSITWILRSKVEQPFNTTHYLRITCLRYHSFPNICISRLGTLKVCLKIYVLSTRNSTRHHRLNSFYLKIRGIRWECIKVSRASDTNTPRLFCSSVGVETIPVSISTYLAPAELKNIQNCLQILHFSDLLP